MYVVEFSSSKNYQSVPQQSTEEYLIFPYNILSVGYWHKHSISARTQESSGFLQFILTQYLLGA